MFETLPSTVEFPVIVHVKVVAAPTVAAPVWVQLFEAVTVTLYVPAYKPVHVVPVAELLQT